MTPAEFRAALADAGLRQNSFVRLCAQLSGQPGLNISGVGTVSRWATGRRAIPWTVAVILALWRMLHKKDRRRILEDINPD